MASPQSTTSHEDSSKKNLEQITFRFCAECSNMLYPKEDADAHKLQFTCRTCQYTEEAASTCVFRNVLNNAAGETAGVTQDVGSDPTVGTACSVVDAASAFAASASSAKFSCTSSIFPLQAPVFCLCCGTTIVCRGCGDLLYSPKPTASSTTSDTSMSSLSETSSLFTDSTDLTDLTNATNATFEGMFCDSVTALADAFEYDNDIDFYIS